MHRLRFSEWLLRVLRKNDTLALEVFLAFEAVVVGIYVLLPGEPALVGEVLIPEVLLGGVLLTHGVGATLALYHLDAAMSKKSALASVFVWLFVAVIMVGTPPTDLIVVPLILGFVGAAVWAYLRLSVWSGAD